MSSPHFGAVPKPPWPPSCAAGRLRTAGRSCTPDAPTLAGWLGRPSQPRGCQPARKPKTVSTVTHAVAKEMGGA